MSRIPDLPTVEVVCPDPCNHVVVRTAPEGESEVRTRAFDGDRWRTTNLWDGETMTCPACKRSGFVDAFKLIAAHATSDKRRVRITLTHYD